MGRSLLLNKSLPWKSMKREDVRKSFFRQDGQDLIKKQEVRGKKQKNIKPVE